MNIHVDTPNFCPDNCPGVQLDWEDDFSPGIGVIGKRWICRNESICKAVYERAKEKLYD